MSHHNINALNKNFLVDRLHTPLNPALTKLCSIHVWGNPHLFTHLPTFMATATPPKDGALSDESFFIVIMTHERHGALSNGPTNGRPSDDHSVTGGHMMNVGGIGGKTSTRKGPQVRAAMSSIRGLGFTQQTQLRKRKTFQSGLRKVNFDFINDI